MLLLPLTMVACALEDGQPWAEVRGMELGVEIIAPIEAGSARFQTDLNYRVELEQFVLRDATSATLHVGPVREGGALSFDPRNPPPGYTNCHADHCHLVDNPSIIVLYEDIEAELRATGGSGADSFLLVWSRRIGSLDPLNGGGTIHFDECDGPCHLERGRLSHVELAVPKVSLRGRVIDLDRRSPRFPEDKDAMEFAFEIEDLAIRGALEGLLDRGERLGVRVEGDVVITERLFHELEFESLLPDAPAESREALLDALRENLARHLIIEAQVHRD